MALRSGEVCYVRPARKRARVFTASDVKRIAKYAHEDGADPYEIIAGVVVFLGFGTLLCKVAQIVQDVLSVTKALIKIGGILALAKIADMLINALSNKLLKKVPVIKKLSILLIVLLTSFKDLFSSLDRLLSNADTADEVSGVLNELCRRTTQLIVNQFE